MDPDPCPYSLGWKDNGSSSQITHICTMSFAFGQKFIDKVTCDVTTMDCCGLLIGKPYQYDRKTHYDAFNNTYTLQQDNKTYLMKCIKSIANLVLSCRQARKAINQAKELALIFIRLQFDNSKANSLMSKPHASLGKLL